MFDWYILRHCRRDNGPGAAPSQRHGAAPGPGRYDPEDHTLVLLSMRRADLGEQLWASWWRTLADICDAEGALLEIELQDAFIRALRDETGW
jgi:hypothetical protein